jgi:carboxyl-terminal processing protease
MVLLICLLCLHACEDMDDKITSTPGLEVQNFVWKGLNLYYLWQDQVPELSEDNFSNQQQLDEWLRTQGTPEELFQNLLYKPASKFPANEAVDRFSVIVNDYAILENSFAGVSKTNGVDFELRYMESGSNRVFGWVRYIIPGSDAATKDIKRGDIFYAVDGVELTDENYRNLLAPNSYTLNLANYNNGNFTPNGEAVDLIKSELTENPVLIKNIIESDGKKIAYLMYNAFTANFDNQLNAAFGEFAAAGATHLVLDLRYNSGGAIQSATRLASMITGQFNGQLFAKQQWNTKLQPIFEADNPANLINKFINSMDGSAINSLNLNKVYILTSRATASASELVINGLRPYINVVQIGDKTTGKNVGSVTLYDSPNFGKNNRSSKHRYAMQPLVLKIVNKDGFGDYQTGLPADISVPENIADLGILGDQNERLLNAAIAHITASGRPLPQLPDKLYRAFKTRRDLQPFGNEMYIHNFSKQ